MNLTVAIETSSARYAIALGTGRSVSFEVEEEGERRDLAAMLQQGLGTLGAQPADIAAIAVDIGPGSLGSLRDGAAFGNGLAYALGLSVTPFVSFELMGAAAYAATGRPVLCTRRGNEGLVYAGVFDGERVTIMRHGALADILPRVARGSGFATAGTFRALTCPGVDLADSGVERPLARTMIEGDLPSRAGVSAVFPLTESSKIFHE